LGASSVWTRQFTLERRSTRNLFPQALANSKISLFDLSTIRIFARLEYKSVQKIDL